MKRSFPKNYTDIQATLAAICKSPSVHEFVIGITDAPSRRRSSYQRWGYPHFAVLATGFKRGAACSLEDWLQGKFAKHPKYHPDKKGKPHRVGASVKDPDAKNNVLYVAWE